MVNNKLAIFVVNRQIKSKASTSYQQLLRLYNNSDNYYLLGNTK